MRPGCLVPGSARSRQVCLRHLRRGPEQLRYSIAGPIALEYSAFAVGGRPDLGLVIYNPATPADADRIRSLIKA
jgi:hypothetical protein